MPVKQSRISTALVHIERTGNRLPHPTLLFIYLCGFILLLSAVFSLLGTHAIHPINGETIQTINLISANGLHRMLQHTVSNFTQFAPVGTVLIAILGIGIAEHSGLLASVLRATVLKAPEQLLTFIIVLSGVLSSLAADTGYVVLIPLAGIIFHAAGRNPIVGIAAAFAGVSGGYSANLLIGPLDAILAGISTEAAVIIDKNYVVSAAGNYYFIFTSTLLVSLIGCWVTENIVAPQLGNYSSTDEQKSSAHDNAQKTLSKAEIRGLKAVLIFSIVFIDLLLYGLIPDDGALRNPVNGDILSSPFIKGIVTIISVYAGISGVIYGKVSGSFSSNKDIVTGMESSMKTMSSYLVLMFFAAQFVSYFSWSQLGIIFAIKGANSLQALQLAPSFLLIIFILFAALINLLIGSASAKWALLAPIFVPMLLLTGISPETTQLAFRIGDSSTNIITPLMPYFGVVVSFVQRYDKSAGMGTIIAMMLPYSIALLIGWSIMLLIWLGFDWPLGPNAPIFMS